MSGTPQHRRKLIRNQSMSGVSVWIGCGIESDRRETADGPHRGGGATRWHGPAHRAWVSDRLFSAEPQLPGGPDAQELQARLPDPDSDAQCVMRASIDHGAGNGVGRRRDVCRQPRRSGLSVPLEALRPTRLDVLRRRQRLSRSRGRRGLLKGNRHRRVVSRLDSPRGEVAEWRSFRRVGSLVMDASQRKPEKPRFVWRPVDLRQSNHIHVRL